MTWRDQAIRVHETATTRWDTRSEEDQHFLALALSGEAGIHHLVNTTQVTVYYLIPGCDPDTFVLDDVLHDSFQVSDAERLPHDPRVDG